ncbi:MAG: hypothetical protein IJZ57_07870 [Clostridia bacterium]|nr:hypothetical protein [Clostridia bacterium]
MKKFKHIVSLGYFCSPALEFKRINRRGCSLPFDWLITPNFEKVIELIDSGFYDFLNFEFLFQLKFHPDYYRNIKWNIDFYHDFSAYKPLENQLDDIKSKYNRRIARFFELIKEPTLFCRYITADDYPYIIENYDSILSFFKKFNPENEIIFVTGFVFSNTPPEIPLHFVGEKKKGKGTHPFLKEESSLKAFIVDNVEETSSIQKAKCSSIYKKFKKLYLKIRIKLKMVYIHKQQV